jgi:hypothetical protein
MLANFLFLRNFALKKDTFYQYKYLFIKILQTLNSFWLCLAQFLEYFIKILLIKGLKRINKRFVLRFRKPKALMLLATQTHTHRIQVQFYKYYVCRINIYFGGWYILCDMSNNVYYRMWRL